MKWKSWDKQRKRSTTNHSDPVRSIARWHRSIRKLLASNITFWLMISKRRHYTSKQKKKSNTLRIYWQKSESKRRSSFWNSRSKWLSSSKKENLFFWSWLHRDRTRRCSSISSPKTTYKDLKRTPRSTIEPLSRNYQ